MRPVELLMGRWCRCDAGKLDGHCLWPDQPQQSVIQVEHTRTAAMGRKQAREWKHLKAVLFGTPDLGAGYNEGPLPDDATD